ncbi:MAG: stage 0 sporulation protein [Ignavibacteriae bacterium]|nr:stage 0 sporulation protein [Ignavibacteriota bacterium]
MDNKSSSKHNLCMSEHNTKIDSHHSTLVSDKISKEINICINHVDTSNLNNNTYSTLNKNKGEKEFIIAKCKGLLGIQFCKNQKDLNISAYDDIILNVNGTYEFGNIIEIGEIVNLRKYNIDVNINELPIVDRVASESDCDNNVSNNIKSADAKVIFKDLVEQLSLEMKLVDIHYQFDGKKIFFFYTSDGRVDFRELAKKLAGHFKTRIELRQIGVRDEAKMIGGIATCGREYCCASFICSFKKITAEDAYKNNITSSISNYTGPCGKLKCCLAYDI